MIFMILDRPKEDQERPQEGPKEPKEAPRRAQTKTKGGQKRTQEDSIITKSKRILKITLRPLIQNQKKNKGRSRKGQGGINGGSRKEKHKPTLVKNQYPWDDPTVFNYS